LRITVSKILKTTTVVYKEYGSKVTSDPAVLIYNSSTPYSQVLEKLIGQQISCP
jgi:hypothetical protein